MTTRTQISLRERSTILQALAAGVVPRTGLHHIQVGRADEIAAMVRDFELVSEGGSAIRFIIGEYGAGKTFFVNLVRLIALRKKMVAIHADLAPDRRLHATGGQARGLYAEAVRNMATQTKPEGGALANVVERFITACMKDGESRGLPVETIIDERLEHLQDHLGGYDYAAVLKAYWRGSEDGDKLTKTAALRWLRGEYTTKTEARQSLNVRNIIDDADVYDSLKLLAAFVKLAGYSGLLVVFDEMVNLYKLQNSQARNQNYEQVLRILNDVLQGDVGGIGFLLGGTPEFLTDPRRGLYSYNALQDRLAENSFASNGLIDLSGPIVRLQSLSQEDLLILLSNIRAVFAGGDATKNLVPDEALLAFMTHCSQRIGESYFRTPRTTIKAFIQFLAVLEQNPGTDWRSLLGDVEVLADLEDRDVEPASEERDDELASLRL
jgi:hypothetical protein